GGRRAAVIHRAEGATPAAAEQHPAMPGVEAVRSLSGYAWSVVGVTALGFFMRVFLLGSPPLWRDEAFSAVVVRGGWLDMLEVVRHDSAPPLSYLILKLANTASSSPASLRMVSVLAGTAMVPTAAALGRRVGGNRAAILAATAMAVIPAYVVQARDVRMYALASAFVLASYLALWRAVEKPTFGRLAVYAACVALALYSQYFSLAAVGGGLVAAAIVLRPPPRVLVRLGIAAAVGVLALVPWLVAAVPQFQHAGSPFWVEPVGISRIEDLWQEFVAGDTLRSQYPHAVEINLLRLLACAAAAVGGLGWVALAWHSKAEARRRAVFLAAAGLVAVGALILVSFFRPLYDSRYAAVLEVPIVVAVGAGFAWLWPQRRPLGLLVAGTALALLAAHALALGPNPPNDDIRPLLDPLAGQVRDGDFVAVNGPTQYFTVIYYTDAETQARTHMIAASTRWYDGAAQYRADTWMTSIPSDVSGRVYVLAEDTAAPLPMPAGYAQREQRCAATYCLTTWGR
ncbi:MAG: glycosyltransferase family 39 protein, partial [Candidatus Dormibacteraeota bacterium]|nr:glycosyltransferase family 39 protein [Candidatus Dormibacteraeota bacterium]